MISVVITTYNRKKIVREALESVFSQTLKADEIIVVDDGSTDGTVDYLKSQDLPIKIVSKPHLGVANSRNTGIIYASGQYIAFLDSDDLWLPKILESQYKFLSGHSNVPLVYTDQYIDIGEKLALKTRFQSLKLTSREKSFFNMPGFVQFVPIHISSVMARKSIFTELGYFDERLKIHDDTEMWNRICEKYSLGFINKPLSIRRTERDPNRITSANQRRLYCLDGKKYLRIYEARHFGKLTKKQGLALKQSYKVIEGLSKSLTPLHFHLKEFK